VFQFPVVALLNVPAKAAGLRRADVLSVAEARLSGRPAAGGPQRSEPLYGMRPRPLMRAGCGQHYRSSSSAGSPCARTPAKPAPQRRRGLPRRSPTAARRSTRPFGAAGATRACSLKPASTPFSSSEGRHASAGKASAGRTDYPRSPHLDGWRRKWRGKRGAFFDKPLIHALTMCYAKGKRGLCAPAGVGRVTGNRSIDRRSGRERP